MLGGDAETLDYDLVIDLAERVHRSIVSNVAVEVWNACILRADFDEFRYAIVSGVGEFVARECLKNPPRGMVLEQTISLNAELGPTVSACAPAYALAVLATERRP